MTRYPTHHKIDAGFEISCKYQIDILFFDETEIQANVISPTGKSYFVTCSLGYWRCTCWDWSSMWRKMEGAYNCKHIEAVHYHIAYLKFKNLPLTKE